MIREFNTFEPRVYIDRIIHLFKLNKNRDELLLIYENIINHLKKILKFNQFLVRSEKRLLKSQINTVKYLKKHWNVNDKWTKSETIYIIETIYRIVF